MYDNYRFSVIERIKANSRHMDNGCIEYAPTRHKYGIIGITINGSYKTVPASRGMYMASANQFDLPSNVFVCHKCDNPRCVNIDHLFVGTGKDNTQDCIQKGRRAKTHIYAQRERVHSADKVEAIRNATGTYACIAQWYGVSVSYVSKIKAGKLKH